MGLGAVQNTVREAPEDWAAPGGEDALAAASGAEGWRSAVMRVLSKDLPHAHREQEHLILAADSDAVGERAVAGPAVAQAGKCAAAMAARVQAPALRARHRPAPSRPVAKLEDDDFAD